MSNRTRTPREMAPEKMRNAPYVVEVLNGGALVAEIGLDNFADAVTHLVREERNRGRTMRVVMWGPERTATSNGLSNAEQAAADIVRANVRPLFLD